MAQSNRIFLLAIATLMLLFAGNSFAQDDGDGDVDDIDINLLTILVVSRSMPIMF